MRLGVDASNLLAGGGLVHLAAFLRDAVACRRYQRVVVWAPESVISQLPSAPDLLEYRSPTALNSGLVQRLMWTTLHLAAEARRCVDLLFVPGGLYLGNFRPFVTMCQNMLPFDPEQRALFGFSRQGVRLALLRLLQGHTFRRADQTIFLSQYARSEIARQVFPAALQSPVIAHGFDGQFRGVCDGYDGHFKGSVPRLLYVSTLFPYKYQLEVIDMVARLRDAGTAVSVDFVGGGDPAYIDRVRQAVARNKVQDLVRLHGNVSHDALPGFYKQADGFLYASGCENFPIILVEAMATGLPMLSSHLGPMREVLGDVASYFDPRDPEDMAAAVSGFLALTAEQRLSQARSAVERSQQYSWDRCFSATFEALRAVLPADAGTGES